MSVSPNVAKLFNEAIVNLFSQGKPRDTFDFFDILKECDNPSEDDKEFIGECQFIYNNCEPEHWKDAYEHKAKCYDLDTSTIEATPLT